MSTERQVFFSCDNQDQLLDEELNRKLIAQIELEPEEDEVEGKKDMEVACCQSQQHCK